MKTTLENVRCYMPKEIKEKLLKEAKAKGLTLSTYMLIALQKALPKE